MFEFLFKYPASVFAKGRFVLLSSWPVWILAACCAAAALALAWHVRRNRANLTGLRPAVVWMLESSFVALLFLLLWRPALSVTTLRPQQNLVAVVVDDSRSMALEENGSARIAQAIHVLDSGLLSQLRRRFQVRMYRFGGRAERVADGHNLSGGQNATHIGDSLSGVLSDSSGLPLGAVVLLSDGADTSGGIGRDAVAELRRRRVPVHTIGFGRERFSRDLEIAGAAVPARALPGSRLSADVTIVEYGYARRKARLYVREGDRVLAAREVTLKADGSPQSEPIAFQAGAAGGQNLIFGVEVLEGEENTANNAVTRLVNVEAAKPRVLYIEGEPRWEYKFIRRAIEEDHALELVSMLRTTQNKIYRQGIANPKELEPGFPSTAEELFAFGGLIIGSVEANYFTPQQRELIREFANRRGGGVLFLGGRAALGDGGYARSPLAEMFPVRLPEAKGTFHRDEVKAELTPAGTHSPICRFDDDAGRNAEHWTRLPALADYQETGELKPGAVALLELSAGGRRRAPLLAVENYGRGRTAALATSGTWRWQMLQPLEDKTHEIFWQQLLRWLVMDSPARVSASTPRPVLSDEIEAPLRAEVRDKAFQLVTDARVVAHIVGPEGLSVSIDLPPEGHEPGVYTARWTAEKPGSYVAEIVARRGDEEIGRDVMMFRREDGVAEHFRAAQNRELLEKLAEETGGRYYRPEQASRLGEEISYSEAGITVQETRDLWNMPLVFALLLGLRGVEWMLRRRWGVV
jgi:uncharacterized membrane protein